MHIEFQRSVDGVRDEFNGAAKDLVHLFKRIALDMDLELFHIGVDVFLWYAQEDIVWGVADEDR